jgi:hypothetical protein
MTDKDVTLLLCKKEFTSVMNFIDETFETWTGHPFRIIGIELTEEENRNFELVPADLDQKQWVKT